MAEYDIFNGDADGLCALQQLRLVEPRDTHLVTGVKRDIGLLRQVKAHSGDELTVLDISFDKNRQEVETLLEQGARIHYFDHHFAGEMPDHPALETHIDTSPDICTSLLVDDYLQGSQRAWAVTGAFGDNMDDSARQRAHGLGFSSEELGLIQELGIYLNYNGYGSDLADLFFHPADLFRELRPYQNPIDFVDDAEAFKVLQDGYQGDIAMAGSIQSERQDAAAALYLLPNEKWARRVSGVFGNQLARSTPARAHAVLTEQAGGQSYTVSVRAPLDDLRDADTLCRQFETGGGRKGAAGINCLPAEQLSKFIDALWKTYSR